MLDLLTCFEEFSENLNHIQKIGYGKRPIPCQLDAQVSKLIQSFIASPVEDRDLVNSVLSSEHSQILLAFSKRMAALAVRKKSRQILFEGLLAVIFEGWRVDGRENIVALSLVNHSALKLDIDPQELFNEASEFSTTDIARNLDAFLDRADEDKSIESMGYKETLAEDGFRYECTW